MPNPSPTLYTGITDDLRCRIGQHKEKRIDGFTAKYNIPRLVYFESFGDVRNAIEREKQVKAWTRAKPVALIEAVNPNGMICPASGISRRLPVLSQRRRKRKTKLSARVKRGMWFLPGTGALAVAVRDKNPRSLAALEMTNVGRAN